MKKKGRSTYRATRRRRLLLIAAAIGWAVIAVTLTTFATLLLRASQPASLSTTLVISLGVRQTVRDAWALVAGVLIIAAAGEPLRRVRAKQLAEDTPGEASVD